MNTPKAAVQKSMFRMTTSVEAEIAAPPAKVWPLLTDAMRFPAWNSTVTSIEGPIVLGQKLKIRVPTSPRTFTPTVVEFEPERRMVWRDGFAPMFTGTRTYSLTASPGGGTHFAMDEIFSGIMLPLIASSLPDFVPIFAQYAADLKRAAEAK